MHNLKEIVNLQDLFVSTVSYVDLTTYPLAKYYYIAEGVSFTRLFILFIGTFSFLLFLCTVSWRYKRDYLRRHFILCYVLYYQHDKELLDSLILRLYL